jgi:NADH dehydrogenase (ubiquinone) 1 alpha subcomplex subunit 9
MATLSVQAARVCRQQYGSMGVLVVQHRHSSNVVKSQTSNLAAYKRGTGGRSSFSGIVATVFGATGFMGSSMVTRLGKIGSQVIIPYRCDPYVVRPLRLCGELGQVNFLPFDLRNEEDLIKSMKYSNVVINLIGRDWETQNFSFKDVHVEGPRRIAHLARKLGVERFIQVSHMGASPNPKGILLKNGSEVLRTKWQGEMAVLDEFPDATIIRPSDMYGINDRFLFYYMNRWRRNGTSKMSLWKKGEQTIKMPVDVRDVTQGIVNAIYDKDSMGKTYECVGPYPYLLSEIVDYMFRIIRAPYYKRTGISPSFLAKLEVVRHAPDLPHMTYERVEREFVSDVLHDLPTLEDLGVEPREFETMARYLLRVFKFHRHYEEAVGEFALPEKPKRWTPDTGLSLGSFSSRV